MVSPIGAHLSGGKDLRKAVTQALKLNFQTFQVFLQGPTNSKMPSDTEELDALTAAVVADKELQLFVHAPYLINFGSSRATVRDNSQTMLTNNLQRAERLGAQGVVFHGGSSTGDPHSEGLKRLRESLLPLLETLSEASPLVLLEPTAGQGDSLVSSLESIAPYLEALDNHPKLGLCLDTAHLLAAGEELDTANAGSKLLARVDELGLTGRVRLFHANDSLYPRGSHKDRHENLGYGHCHKDLWSGLVKSGVPLVLETPGTHFSSDLKLLRALREAK